MTPWQNKRRNGPRNARIRRTSAEENSNHVPVLKIVAAFKWWIFDFEQLVCGQGFLEGCVGLRKSSNSAYEPVTFFCFPFRSDRQYRCVPSPSHP